MARAVVPRQTDHAMWLLTGFSDAHPSISGRELRIEDADDEGAGAVDGDDDASLMEGAADVESL